MSPFTTFSSSYSSYSIKLFLRELLESGETSFSHLHPHKALHILGFINLFWLTTPSPPSKAHTSRNVEASTFERCNSACKLQAEDFIGKALCFFQLSESEFRISQKGKGDWWHSPLAASSQGLAWLSPGNMCQGLYVSMYMCVCTYTYMRIFAHTYDIYECMYIHPLATVEDWFQDPADIRLCKCSSPLYKMLQYQSHFIDEKTE